MLDENCARCHQQTGWASNVLFDHDLTSFPLIGIHAVALCEACHLSPRFSDTPGLCVDCHAGDDSHENSLGTDCGSCHNPNDWLLWDFNHDTSTRFTLNGAHSDLACHDCHHDGQTYQARPPMVCVTCHFGDDIHAREFGRQCSRCHDTRSFSEIEAIR